MPKEIKKIMGELYELDPSLREVKDLEKVVLKVISAKPVVEIDRQFMARLRQELAGKSLPKAVPISWSVRSLYAFAGAMGVLALMVGLYEAGVLTPGVSQKNGAGNLAFQYDVQPESSRAFGPLTIQPMASGQTYGFGGGGGGNATAPALDSKMIAPGPQKRYVYTYEGELDLSGISNTVYQRVVDPSNASQLADRLKVDLGIIDLSKMTNASLGSFQINENVPDGYQLNVDLANNMVSINKNWLYQIQNTNNRQATLSDIPDDAVLINAANALLARFNVDLSNYGQPVVNKEWRVAYNSALARGDQFWVPTEIAVSYPLVLDGANTYEQYGGTYGLGVSVDIFTKTANSVYNIIAPEFQSSSYDLITDTEIIKQSLSKGGFDSYYYEGMEIQDVPVTLGEPTFSYMHYSQWTGKENKDIFVPALVFPITSVPAGEEMYKTNVVIPLVKEVFDANQPIPMPLIDGPAVR